MLTNAIITIQSLASTFFIIFVLVYRRALTAHVAKEVKITLVAKALAPRLDTISRVCSRGRRTLPLLLIFAAELLTLQPSTTSPVRQLVLAADDGALSPSTLVMEGNIARRP